MRRINEAVNVVCARAKQSSADVQRENRAFMAALAVGLIIGAFIGGMLPGVVPSTILIPMLVVILLISAVKVWQPGQRTHSRVCEPRRSDARMGASKSN